MAELPYLDESTPSVPPIPFSASINVNDFEVKAQKGSANGYAPLDANAKVPVANLPDQASLDAEVAAAISTHNALTDAHGISNTANLVYTNDARLSDARPPAAHSHSISDVTNLQTALDGKQPSGSYAPASGISPSAITGTAVVTNDARLSDARTPLSHDHDDRYYTEAEVDTEVNTKIAAHNAVTAGFHGISDVNDIVFFEDLEAEGYELSSNKNIPNGYAGLDAGGKISLSQLPDANATETEAIGFVLALG